VSDFKQIMQAFGLQLTPQELKQLVVKARMASTGPSSSILRKSQPARSGSDTASEAVLKTPDFNATRKTNTDMDAASYPFKTANGYAQMTPINAKETGSEAPQMRKTSFSGLKGVKNQSRNTAMRSASVNNQRSAGLAGRKSATSPFNNTDTYQRNKTRTSATPGLTLTNQLEATPGINIIDFLRLYA